jgi:predicted DNA-binding transcriptional regulator AlpA
MYRKQIYDECTPIAALSVGDFRELMLSMLPAMPNEPLKKESYTETFGKQECSQMTGYTVNTISKMVSARTIPFYKRNAKVIFVRDEIRAWLLSKRIGTVEEFIAGKENEIINRKRMN